MNNPKYWPMCHEKLRAAIDACAEFGFPNVITFTGFREDIPDDVGMKVPRSPQAPAISDGSRRHHGGGAGAGATLGVLGSIAPQFKQVFLATPMDAM